MYVCRFIHIYYPHASAPILLTITPPAGDGSLSAADEWISSIQHILWQIVF